MPDNNQDNDQPSGASGYDVGLQLFASVLVGTGLGYGLDRWLDTSPWLLLIFMFLGFGAGLRKLWQMMK